MAATSAACFSWSKSDSIASDAARRVAVGAPAATVLTGEPSVEGRGDGPLESFDPFATLLDEFGDRTVGQVARRFEQVAGELERPAYRFEQSRRILRVTGLQQGLPFVCGERSIAAALNGIGTGFAEEISHGQKAF